MVGVDDNRREEDTLQFQQDFRTSEVLCDCLIVSLTQNCVIHLVSDIRRQFFFIWDE